MCGDANTATNSIKFYNNTSSGSIPNGNDTHSINDEQNGGADAEFEVRCDVYCSFSGNNICNNKSSDSISNDSDTHSNNTEKVVMVSIV